MAQLQVDSLREPVRIAHLLPSTRNRRMSWTKLRQLASSE
jgi:hypothetical protein